MKLETKSTILTGARTTEDCRGVPLKLQYGLTVSQETPAQYGVQITALRAGEKTSACIPDITASLETAKRLLHLLADGTVTPETARDVVEDFLEGGDF